jgi:SAM-dependent methyltransferase
VIPAGGRGDAAAGPGERRRGQCAPGQVDQHRRRVVVGHVSDLTGPWPVPPGSVDRIYGDNVIEHFPLDVARAVLRHCHDALRAGGGIRLATPDVERTARAYPENPRLTADHLDRHRRHGFPAEHPVDMLRVTYAYHGRHRGYCFDWAALSAELAAAGFTDIGRLTPGRATIRYSAPLNGATSPPKRPPN